MNMIDQVVTTLQAYKKAKSLNSSTEQFLARLNVLFLEGNISQTALGFVRSIIAAENNSTIALSTACRNIKYKYTIVKGDGSVINVNSLMKFCNEHNLNYDTVCNIKNSTKYNIPYTPVNPIFKNWKIFINR